MKIHNVIYGDNFNILPGDYVLIDPCYVFDNWQEMRSKVFKENHNYGKFSVDKFDVFWQATRYGDGNYICQDGQSVYVDSSLIALIPQPLFDILFAKRTFRNIKFAKITINNQAKLLFDYGDWVINDEFLLKTSFSYSDNFDSYDCDCYECEEPEFYKHDFEDD